MGHTAKSTLCKNNVYKVGSEEELNDITVEEVDSLELGLLQEVMEDKQRFSVEDESHHVYSLSKTKENESLKVKLQIDDKVVLMEVDSGACKSVMHVEDYNKILSHLKLELVNFKLKVVTGENVIIIGQILVTIIHNGKKFKLLLIVLNSINKFIPLLGRN